MSTKVNLTTPITRSSFTQIQLEKYEVDVDSRTITGFYSYADASGERLKSVKFTISLGNQKVDAFNEDILTKLITTQTIPPGTVVSS